MFKKLFISAIIILVTSIGWGATINLTSTAGGGFLKTDYDQIKAMLNGYDDGILGTVVVDTGNQTVAGVKTFSSFPVGPSAAPTTDYQVANKKYVDDNGGSVNWAQTIIVAKSGGDYTTIQAAIDSISDNATDKRYIVLIYPGVYTENVVMEEYVSLVGYDHETTEITSASGTTVTCPPNTSDAGIYNLKISSTPTADGAICLAIADGEIDMYNSYIKMTSATAEVEGTLVDQDGGMIEYNSCLFSYDFDGTNASAGTHSLIDVTGTDTYNFFSCEFIVDVADVNDTVIGINETAGATITEGYFTDSIVHINLSNVSYSGSCGLFYLHGTGVNKQFKGNHIHLSSDGDGTGYIFYMDTTAGGGIITSVGNVAICEGFTNNYSGNVAAGDTVNGSFITHTASSGSTGAGTFNGVSASPAGSLVATGNISGATYGSDGSVSDAELLYVDATSSIQTQLNGKAATTRKLDDFGTPDDNTDLNATTSYHGLCPKFPGGTTDYLRADGSFATPAGGGATAWDDIGDPDAASSIQFGTYTTELYVDDYRIGKDGTDYIKFSDTGVTLHGAYTMSTGTVTVADEAIAIQTGTSDADFFEFAAYDVDGTAYNGLLRLVAGDTIYGYLGDNQTNAIRWDESGNLTFQGTADIDLPNNSVDNADMSDDSVDSDEIVDGAVDLGHLSAGAKFYSIAVADLGDSTTPSVLTTAETTNKCISNYKSSGADHVFTMPAAHAAGNIIFSIGDEFQIDIEPNTSDLFYLNGTAMAADEHIQNTADTLGQRIVGYCVNINGTLRWMFYSSDSDWVEETP